ncbi:MAG TPA: AMP-binding protein, partial [Steroidobacteraceae bacterium]|nr:AMP-binding protein [Steroidobacteraceae bacterium]
MTAETAAAYGIVERGFTYREAAGEVERLRAAYASAGYGPGQRVGLLLFNRPEFLFHWLALNALGVSVVPINPDWRQDELGYLVGHSEIALAVASVDRHATLAAAARSVSRSLTLVSPDGKDIVAATSGAPGASEAPSLSTECALLYTSGTTGRPKGCILPNEYFLWAGHWYAGLGGLCEIRPGVERMITPLPLTHMNAMAYSTMCMVLTGGCL